MLRLAPLVLLLSAQAITAQALAAQLPDTGTPEAVDTSLVEVGPDREALDRDAEETLQALFDRMQGLEGVTVEVDAGLARLTGQVASPEVRGRAADVARRIEGISFVDNRLELPSSPMEQLDPAVERLEGRLSDLVALLPSMLVALLALAMAFLLARWIGGVAAPYRALTDNPFVENVLRQLARLGIVLAGVLVAVEVLDVTALIGAVIGTAGIAGLALGFAFKDIVENYLAGLLLSLRQPFDPNDTVVLQEITGKVIRLTSRETILMDLNGNHVRIPNATVFRSVLVNYTRNPLRRFEIPVAIATGEDLTHAIAVGRDALGEMKSVLDEPEPGARIESVGESWVDVVWFGWVDQRSADFLKVKSEAIRRLLEALEAAGVDMPPPERRIRLVADAGPAPPGPGGEERPERVRRGRDRPAPVDTGEEAEDVSVDRTLDEQIEEDRRTSDEEDLLGS